MRVTFTQVIDALNEFKLSFPKGIEQDIGPFSGFELFLGQPMEPDVLYVVEGHAPERLDGARFLTVAERSVDESTLHVCASSAAIVANALVRYAMRLSQSLDNMRERLCDHRDIQGFCQAIADFAGNPVIAYDSSLLPCAQTEFPEDIALEVFGAEKADRDFVLRTVPDWKRQDGEDVFARTGARRLSDSEQKVSTAACNVLANGEFQGFLEIFEVHKPITDGEMTFLEEAAKIAANAPFPFGESGLVLGHLQGRPVQGGLTASWLSALRWRAEDGTYVIAIDVPTDRRDDKLYIDHVIRMTRLVVPFSVSQQMGEMPVVVANDRLVPRGKAVSDVASFLAKLGGSACVGASEVMDGIGRLHEGFVHAQFAARHARVRSGRQKHGQGAMLFEECRFAFLSEICSFGDNAELIVDARVARMHDDDMSSGSENTLTAKTYIETGFNLNATAQHLSVHRNTVAYRLKHIAERYGIDLSSPIPDLELVFFTLLSAKILLENAAEPN